MPRPGQTLLSLAINEYLDLRQGRYSEATVYNDTYVLRRFLREMGDVQVMNVSAEKVDRWFASLLSKHGTADGQVREPVAPISYNNIGSRVLGFSRYCQARGLTRARKLDEHLRTRGVLGPRPGTQDAKVVSLRSHQKPDARVSCGAGVCSGLTL